MYRPKPSRISRAIPAHHAISLHRHRLNASRTFKVQQLNREPRLHHFGVRLLQNRPASGLIRVRPNPSEPSQAISASGSLETSSSRMIFPLAPTTRSSVSNDTWIPA
jgi:hypothetical protein